jgi:hypothetical protein
VELWRATKLRNHVREDHQRICQRGPLILAVHALCARNGKPWLTTVIPNG